MRAFTRRDESKLAPVAEEHGQVVEPEPSEKRDPEKEARRRLALAQIRQYPDPALRMKAADVVAFDDDLRSLAARMFGLMDDASGIGLAAPQIGVVRRMFVCRLGEDEEADPHAFVNPVIAAVGDGRESGDEGCLSMQGVLVPVERPTALTLEARDLAGQPVRLELEDLDARVVQHELDHLDGVLIIDRTTDEARRGALATLRPRPVLVGD
jgi:peptide deformylase